MEVKLDDVIKKSIKIENEGLLKLMRVLTKKKYFGDSFNFVQLKELCETMRRQLIMINQQL